MWIYSFMIFIRRCTKFYCGGVIASIINYYYYIVPKKRSELKLRRHTAAARTSKSETCPWALLRVSRKNL